MLKQNQYILQVNSLVEGRNRLDIEVDKELFDKFDCTEAQDLRVNVGLDIEKSDNLLSMSFLYKGWIDVLCGRCLGKMSLKVDKSSKQIVQMIDNGKHVDWMEGFISPYTKQIDLSPYIYEELRVVIPIAPIHAKESDCDKKMIDRLLELNSENQKNKEDYINPIWEKLRDLKTN